MADIEKARIFTQFLDQLRDHDPVLVESVKQGFDVCFEGFLNDLFGNDKNKEHAEKMARKMRRYEESRRHHNERMQKLMDSYDITNNPIDRNQILNLIKAETERNKPVNLITAERNKNRNKIVNLSTLERNKYTNMNY